MTNEVLQQFGQIVSDILDTKLKTELQPIRDDIREMKAEMAVMKADIEEMKAEIAVMKTDIEEMKAEIEKLWAAIDSLNARFEELQCRVASIGLHVENETDKYVRIVAENHIELSKKLDRAISTADRQSVYEMKVNHLEKEVDEIRNDVDVLKQKMA